MSVQKILARMVELTRVELINTAVLVLLDILDLIVKQVFYTFNLITGVFPIWNFSQNSLNSLNSTKLNLYET